MAGVAVARVVRLATRVTGATCCATRSGQSCHRRHRKRRARFALAAPWLLWAVGETNELAHSDSVKFFFWLLHIKPSIPAFYPWFHTFVNSLSFCAILILFLFFYSVYAQNSDNFHSHFVCFFLIYSFPPNWSRPNSDIYKKFLYIILVYLDPPILIMLLLLFLFTSYSPILFLCRNIILLCYPFNYITIQYLFIILFWLIHQFWPRSKFQLLLFFLCPILIFSYRIILILFKIMILLFLSGSLPIT